MLSDLKLLIGFPSDDTDLDPKLNLILLNSKARLKLLLGNVEPPPEMNHIILDVAVMRFNRIGSEGFSNHSVEGENLSFVDDDFSGFAGEIQAWLDLQEERKKKKTVRFL